MMKEKDALQMLEQFTDEDLRFICAAILYIQHMKEREQVHRLTAVQ